MDENNPIEGLDPSQSAFEPLMDQTMPEGVQGMRTTTTTTMYISGAPSPFQIEGQNINPIFESIKATYEILQPKQVVDDSGLRVKVEQILQDPSVSSLPNDERKLRKVRDILSVEDPQGEWRDERFDDKINLTKRFPDLFPNYSAYTADIENRTLYKGEGVDKLISDRRINEYATNTFSYLWDASGIGAKNAEDYGRKVAYAENIQKAISDNDLKTLEKLGDVEQLKINYPSLKGGIEFVVVKDELKKDLSLEELEKLAKENPTKAGLVQPYIEKKTPSTPDDDGDWVSEEEAEKMQRMSQDGQFNRQDFDANDVRSSGYSIYRSKGRNDISFDEYVEKELYSDPVFIKETIAEERNRLIPQDFFFNEEFEGIPVESYAIQDYLDIKYSKDPIQTRDNLVSYRESQKEVLEQAIKYSTQSVDMDDLVESYIYDNKNILDYEGNVKPEFVDIDNQLFDLSMSMISEKPYFNLSEDTYKRNGTTKSAEQFKRKIILEYSDRPQDLMGKTYSNEEIDKMYEISEGRFTKYFGEEELDLFYYITGATKPEETNESFVLDGMISSNPKIENAIVTDDEDATVRNLNNLFSGSNFKFRVSDEGTGYDAIEIYTEVDGIEMLSSGAIFIDDNNKNYLKIVSWMANAIPRANDKKIIKDYYSNIGNLYGEQKRKAEFEFTMYALENIDKFDIGGRGAAINLQDAKMFTKDILENSFIPKEKLSLFNALLNNAQYVDNLRESKQGSTLFDVAKQKLVGGFFEATDFVRKFAEDISITFGDQPPELTYGKYLYRKDGTKRSVSEAQDMWVKDRKIRIAEDSEFITQSASGSKVKEAWLSENAPVYTQAAAFFTESLGVSLSVGGPWGSGTAGMAGFFMYGVNGLEDQMMSEDFDNLTEWEKKMISWPYGIVIGALEKLGFEGSVGAYSNGTFGKISRRFIQEALTDIPENASREVIETAIRNSVKARFLDGSIKFVAGGISEGFVEGTQEVFDVSAKKIINKIQGFDQFKDVAEMDLTTVDGWIKLQEQVGEAAWLGMLGGGYGSGGSVALGSIRSGYVNIKSNKEFKEFYTNISNEELLETQKMHVLMRFQSEQISKEQANAEIDALDKMYSISQEIPTDLNTNQTHQAFDLLSEKRKIQEDIEGKQENLVKEQKERLKDIDRQLELISKGEYKDAIQEQETDEKVLPAKGPEVGLQEVDVQEITITEQATEEEALKSIQEENKVREKNNATPIPETEQEISKRKEELSQEKKTLKEQGEASIQETKRKKKIKKRKEEEAKQDPYKQAVEKIEEKKREIKPETSSNYANLTEDEDGNFVFYHVGEEGYETIKPASGKTKATSREERGALSKVGGMGMYYTQESDEESMVTGDAKYAVKVPKSKVYDFNSDPEGFIEEARRRHDRDNPGMAFDPNSQVAYVAQVASENGYDVVVSEWDGRTRAQSVKELKVSDTKIKEGNRVTKEFDNTYKSNKDKGYESVIPADKDDQLEDVYMKIKNEKGDNKEYDKTYFLFDSRSRKKNYNQEQITKMVNESNVSQEIKDEYNAIMEAKPEQRRSEKVRDNIAGVDIKYPTAQEEQQRKEERTKPEYVDDAANKNQTEDVESFQKDLEGEFGMLTGENPLGKPLTEQENQQLNQKAEEWLKKKGYKPRKVTGKYGQAENSFFVPGLTKEDAIAFANEFNQESVAHSDGMIFQDGTMNPRVKSNDNFTMDQYTPESDMVSVIKTEDGLKTFSVGYDFESVAEAIPKPKPKKSPAKKMKQRVDRIMKQVDNAKKAISKIIPGVEIVTHKDEDSYRKATGETDSKKQTSRGEYNPNTKKIHINLSKANNRTVAHEVFHAILLNKLNTDKATKDLTERMIKSLSKNLEGMPEVKKALDEFAANYDENIQSEEKLAELVGILAENYGQLGKTNQSLIKRFLDRLAKMFGLKPFTDNEVAEVLNTIAGKVAVGEEISDVDLKVIASPTDSKGNLKTPSKNSQNNLNQRKQNIIDGVKDQVVSGKTVSTSLPNKDNVHSSKEYVVGMSSLEEMANTDKRAKDQYIKIAKEAASYGISKTKDVNNFEDAKKVISEVKEVVKSNLKWLHDSVDKDVRDISKLWYDGANKISNDLANEYGYTTEQVSGVMAVLSPQMDWFRNLSLGERVINIYKNNQDSLFDEKMIEFVNTKTTGTGKNKKPLFKNKEEITSRVKNKKLSELNPKDQSYFIRVYDEVYNSRNYNNITPNGEINGLVRTKSGNPGKVGWGDFSTIEKAISILNDGSVKNISTNLGNQHKVRNFFNNISNPNDKNAVTIDTHAVAAALLKPLSGKSKQVAYNFGGSSAVSTGMTGTYPVYADAYRELAKELGILPREVQSITWEAGRGLFKAAFKANKSNGEKIDNIWNQYESGSISLKEAQSKIDKLAGGISTPVWYEYLANENVESLDKNSAALDQAALDEEVSIDDQVTTPSKRKQKGDANMEEAIQRALMKFELSAERGNTRSQAIKSAIADLRKNDWYKSATDIQRDEAVRDIKENFGIKSKKGPSTRKILGQQKRTKITVTLDQMAEYKKQIKEWNRSARLAKKDINTRRKELGALVKSMVKGGIMTSKQAAILVERASKINLENEMIVNRFVEYAQKVFENAEYAQKFQEAISLRRKIKKNLKRDNQAEVIAMGKKFADIDPQMVEDIDAYIEYADQMYEALRASRIKGLEVDFSQAANLAEMSDFYDEAIANQNKILKKEMIAKYQELGLTEDMSIEEIREIVNAIEGNEVVEGKEKEILSFIQKRFGVMTAIAKDMIGRGVNPFTGESIDITEHQKDMIKRMIKADISKMDIKNAIKFVEYMDNFITNEITSGLESAISIYEGEMSIVELMKSKVRGRMPKLGFSEAMGELWNRQLTSLPVLFDRIFQGTNRGLKVMQKIGVQEIMNGKAKKTSAHNKIMQEYSKKFIDGDKSFMNAENVYERGMVAFMSRNIVGTQAEQKMEFERRKKLVAESIETLEKSKNRKERNKAKVYREVYNRLGIMTATDIASIKSKSSAKNLASVNWWTDQWADKYSDLADVSLSVYNTILGTDTNYTPDKYKVLSKRTDISRREVEEAANKTGAFMSGTHIDRNKSGVLMETTRPKALPKGRYVSFDFDIDNFNSMDKALTDIYTASAIQKFYGASQSSDFDEVFGDTAGLIRDRVASYIKKMKGRDEFTGNKEFNKVLNTVAKFGVSKALGGLSQAFKQTVPVMMNTLTNAGRFDFAQREDLAWVNESMMSIANRGLEAETAIDSADSKIDVNTSDTLRSIGKKIDWMQGMYLKAFLQAPDVYVAKSSFISYYKQYMKRKGLSTELNQGEYNQDALEYAQMMVDRQQNISDNDLAGEFLSGSRYAMTRKVVAPFASFVLNQKARMMADLRVLNPANKAVTNEDRKAAARSLAGLMVELTVFHTMSAAIREVFKMAAKGLFGDDDDDDKEEDEWGSLESNKKIWAAGKYAMSSVIKDILSPFPAGGDMAVDAGINELIDMFDINLADEDDVQKAVDAENEIRLLNREDPMSKKEISELRKSIMEQGEIKVWEDEAFLKDLGVLTIGPNTVRDLNDAYNFYKDGYYVDDRGRKEKKRYILDRDKEDLGFVVFGKLMTAIGLAPKDVGDIARYGLKEFKKETISEEKYEKYTEIKKEIKREPTDGELYLILNSGKSNENIVEDINLFKKYFEGITEKEAKEFVDLKTYNLTEEKLIIQDIKSGMTALEIKKAQKKRFDETGSPRRMSKDPYYED